MNIPARLSRFLTAISTLKLPAARKRSMRAAVGQFVMEYPVRDREVIRHIGRDMPKPSFTLPLFRPMPIALILTLMFGTGTVFAAEHAVPGDLLYPVKINVNENLRGQFNVSEASKAEWSVKRAERRLEEATELKASGQLDANTRIQLMDEYKDEASEAHTHIKALTKSGQGVTAATIQSSLDTVVEAHAEILSNTQSEPGMTPPQDTTSTQHELDAGVKTDIQVDTDVTAPILDAHLRGDLPVQATGGLDL